MLFLLALAPLFGYCVAQDQATYWATAARSCAGPSDGPPCPGSLPLRDRGPADWDPNIGDFGGAYPTPAALVGKTEAKLLKRDGTSEWLILSEFVFDGGVKPNGVNSTIVGMDLTLYLKGKNVWLLPEALRVQYPDLTWGTLAQPFAVQKTPSTDVEVDLVLGTGETLWNTTAGSSIASYNYEHPNAGFALFMSLPVPDNPDNKDRNVRFYAARMRVYSTVPGQDTTAATTGVSTTRQPGDLGENPSSSPSSSRTAIYVGAGIGGAVLVAGLVVLLVLLVRKRARAQPAYQLDAPASTYHAL